MSAEQAKLWTIAGLSVELKLDRKTIAKRIEDLPPDQVDKRSKRWKMARVFSHLGEITNPLEDKARLDRLRGDKVEMELAETRGELVRAAFVAEAWSGIATTIKTKMLGIPTKAAPMLVGMKNPAEIQKLLEQFVYEGLEELASGDAIGFLGGESSELIKTAAETDSQRVG